jgi:putative membrane protein
MAYILLRWILNALGIMLVTYLIPGISVANFYTALIVALVLGILNALIRPVLIFLTLPINILTLGLFTLVINALILWFVSSVVKGFTVSSFSAAFWGALLLWLIGWLSNTLLKENL